VGQLRPATGRPPGQRDRSTRHRWVCRYDPTGTFTRSWFSRIDFAGSLFDRSWPDGSEWYGALAYRGAPALWRVEGNRLFEIGGGRVVVATGHHVNPTLRPERRRQR
jgi:hypothetical protein